MQYKNLANSANDNIQYMNLLNTTNNDVQYMNVSNPMALCNDDESDDKQQRKSDPLVSVCNNIQLPESTLLKYYYCIYS